MFFCYWPFGKSGLLLLVIPEGHYHTPEADLSPDPTPPGKDMGPQEVISYPPERTGLDSSVHNRSSIIAQYGVSNAKPSMVDLILPLPETNFR